MNNIFEKHYRHNCYKSPKKFQQTIFYIATSNQFELYKFNSKGNFEPFLYAGMNTVYNIVSQP